MIQRQCTQMCKFIMDMKNPHFVFRPNLGRREFKIYILACMLYYTLTSLPHPKLPQPPLQYKNCLAIAQILIVKIRQSSVDRILVI